MKYFLKCCPCKNISVHVNDVMKIAFPRRVHALLQEAALKNTVSAYPGIISMSGSIKTAHFYVVQLCGRAAHTHILSEIEGKKNSGGSVRRAHARAWYLCAGIAAGKIK